MLHQLETDGLFATTRNLFPSMLNQNIKIFYSQFLKKYAIRFLLLLLNPSINFIRVVRFVITRNVCLPPNCARSKCCVTNIYLLQVSNKIVCVEITNAILRKICRL